MLLIRRGSGADSVVMVIAGHEDYASGKKPDATGARRVQDGEENGKGQIYLEQARE
jgi:hypothetical protein